MKDFKLECIIYALICPITKEIRYIGKTKHSLKRRLSVHIRQKSKCKKSLWIKSLIEKKLVPEIILIENCSNKNWKQREIYHISLYDNLLNQNKGGAGGLNEKNDYIKIYKENISLRKGKSTIYNYLSVVSKFLKHFNSFEIGVIFISLSLKQN